MPQFENILKSIDNAINRFNRRIPATQKDILSGIEEELRKLDLNVGKIKATVSNLTVISRIKAKLAKIILTDDYKAEVKQFASAFNDITALQNEYWSSLEATFKPRALLKEIKNQSIEDTVNKLTEAGIGANVSDEIADILRTNITTGGSYADLADQLREMLTTTKTPGLLEKYVKQVTVDSINQYNRTYTQVVSSDLGFEWFKYSNSEIDSSRPFCRAMVENRPYFHISEVPALLAAQGLFYKDPKTGQEKAVTVYPKTGLPQGFIPGTNAENFFVRAGGYSCGHSIRPLSENLVPEEVKSRVFATLPYIKWKRSQS